MPASISFAPRRLSWLLATCVLATPAWAAPWLDSNHQPTLVAQQAVQRLNDAALDGLNPADYEAARLAAALKAPSAAQAPQLEAELTRQVTRYLQHLHSGRVDPRQLKEDYNGKDATPFDAEGVLQQAWAANSMQPALHAATPKAPGYSAVRQALVRERQLATHAAWEEPVTAKSLKTVAQRLEAMGDMKAVDVANVNTAMTSALQNGVKSFQKRMGLAANGQLNKATLAALNQSPLQRAERLALTLERLRWTPLEQNSRMIVVNIPEFRLRAYEIQDGKPDVKVNMRVVVGKALDTRTPLFDEDMTLIEFAPYWNVPASIARKELVPRIQRDPGYLNRAGFEIVGTGGLEGVLKGTARLRQKPGPQNALGDIKFVLPNNQAIYLHHTTATGLFNRERRDFSHGCVRVEEPVKLAQFVLQNDPAWTKERIEKAMKTNKSSTVRLKEPIPVVLTYMTAIVQGGQPYFFNDVYGHDKSLVNLLSGKKATVAVKPAAKPAAASAAKPASAKPTTAKPAAKPKATAASQ